MWYQQKLRGKNCPGLCVKNGEKQKKSLQQESWESQHGETMSFPAHQHIHVICVVKIYSPLAPAATLNAVCRQEVGQKPIFVPVLLWLHHGPCTSEKKGRSGGSPGSVLGWDGCPGPQLPLCSLTRERMIPPTTGIAPGSAHLSLLAGEGF